MRYQVPKEDYINPKAEIRTSGTKGKGLFAKEKIAAGETVVIRGGDKYTDKIGAEKADKQLVMQRDEDLFSIEDRQEDDSYFINHSCNGNLWLKDAFTLAAKREIEKDEEITADYALWEGDKNKISKRECRCGETNCRKRITGKDYMLKEVQKQYAGHFSPLINKRILSGE